MRIDPRLVIEFSVVACEGSFTRAAQRLQMAQPWLSARIRRLEDLVGFPLLVRNTRSVTLTERGAELLSAATDLASAADDVEAAVLQLRRKQRGRLRIGAPPYMKRLRERRALIEHFVSSCPDVTLELETGWSRFLQDRLVEGQIDLAFTMGDHDANRLEGMCLRTCGLAVFMSDRHPLAGRAVLAPADLGSETIHVFTRSLNPQLWDQLYAPLPASARIVENHEMAEGPPDMSPEAGVAAFFDFGVDMPPPAGMCLASVRAELAVPLMLLRRRGSASLATAEFWREALRLYRTVPAG